jgi:hypothetical protein
VNAKALRLPRKKPNDSSSSKNGRPYNLSKFFFYSWRFNLGGLGGMAFIFSSSRAHFSRISRNWMFEKTAIRMNSRLLMAAP